MRRRAGAGAGDKEPVARAGAGYHSGRLRKEERATGCLPGGSGVCSGSKSAVQFWQ